MKRSTSNTVGLVRAIGRVGFTALVVNCIIGTSIFGTPGEVYRELGPAAPLVMTVGAAFWLSSWLVPPRWGCSFRGAAAVIYIGICASLIRLRRRNPTENALRIPCGRAAAVAGIAVSVVLLTQLDAGRIGLMLIAASIAGANWLWAASAERQRRVIASGGAT